MKKSVGLKLWNKGKVSYYNPTDVDLDRGEWAIVKTERGLTPAMVCLPSRPLLPMLTTPSLQPIVRKATEKDQRRIHDCLQLTEGARNACREKISTHNLSIRLSDVEVLFDRSRLIVSFTAEQRTDFRALVKELAAQFRIRVEMKQIGVRDEAGFLGGVGSCGRQLCCSLFLTKFHPITTKMVRAQNLAVNNSQLLGACGRLKCCLAYEYEAKRPNPPPLIQLQV